MMSTTKPDAPAWTPGPWTTDHDPAHDGGHAYTVWTSKGPGFGAVAHVAPYCPPYYAEGIAEAEANATLCSAAPDLYAALDNSNKLLAQALGLAFAVAAAGWTELPPGLLDDMQRAGIENQAALRKARGEA